MDANTSNSSTSDAWSDLTTPTMKWCFRLLFSGIFLLGIIGNGNVCLTIALKQRLRTTPNLLVLNLSATDFIFVALYTPTQLSFFENNYSWVMGDAVCKLTYTVLPTCLSSSVGTLLCIAVMRYKAVSSLLQARLGLSHKSAAVVITMIWLVSLLTGLPVLLVAKTTTSKDKIFCSEMWPVDKPYEEIYWIFIFIIQYAIPLVVIAFLSIATLMKVKRSRRRVLQSASNSNNKDNTIASRVLDTSLRQRRRQENNMSRLLTCLVVLYAICMLPQHGLFFWLKYGDFSKQKYGLYIFAIANAFPIANSALNSVVYGSRCKRELKTSCHKCA